MDLIFWRHAEAEDEREGLPDLDRALTSRVFPRLCARVRLTVKSISKTSDNVNSLRITLLCFRVGIGNEQLAES